MPEQIFLEQNGVFVTSSRFMVPGETYAMSGITSVKENIVRPNGSFILGLIGVFVLFTNAVFGSILLIIAIFWWKRGTEYTVALKTSGGEVQALRSSDEDFIHEVVVALNQAIVARG